MQQVQHLAHLGFCNLPEGCRIDGAVLDALLEVLLHVGQDAAQLLLLIRLQPLCERLAGIPLCLSLRKTFKLSPYVAITRRQTSCIVLTFLDRLHRQQRTSCRRCFSLALSVCILVCTRVRSSRSMSAAFGRGVLGRTASRELEAAGKTPPHRVLMAALSRSRKLRR